MSKRVTRRERRAGRVKHEPPPPPRPAAAPAAPSPIRLAGETSPTASDASPTDAITTTPAQGDTIALPLRPRASPRAKLLLAALIGMLGSVDLGPEPRRTR